MNFIIEQQTNSQPQTPICRICLQQADNTQNPLIIPCQCKGSVQFVHTLCLKRWIMVALKSQPTQQQLNTLQRTIKCQICQFKIKYTVRQYLMLNSCEQFQKEFTKQICGFVIFIISFVICTFCFAFILANLDEDNGVDAVKIASIIFATIMLILAVILVIITVRQFALKTHTEIVKITVLKMKKKEEGKQNNSIEVRSSIIKSSMMESSMMESSMKKSLMKKRRSRIHKRPKSFNFQQTQQNIFPSSNNQTQSRYQ